MSFIKSNCISVTVSLLRLLKNLEQLSEGKYNSLYAPFDEICNSIRGLIEQKKEAQDERLIIPLTAIDRTRADLVGSKMANLGEILNLVKLKVPAGFSITARAYEYFMSYNDLQTEIDRRFISTDITDMEALYALSRDIQALITEAPLPEDLEAEIHRAYSDLEQEMGGSLSVALRSSAMGEDSAANSFAGQYRSELNVRQKDLITTYKEIVASKYGFTAITYRLNKGIRDEDIFMSVGCITMVDARSGGVMYTRNPLDAGDSSVFINSAWGLPKAVVDGSVDRCRFPTGILKKKKPSFSAMLKMGSASLKSPKRTGRSLPSLMRRPWRWQRWQSASSSIMDLPRMWNGPLTGTELFLSFNAVPSTKPKS
jgi:pyruvate,water dikinase